jgi:hypothetical protein
MFFIEKHPSFAYLGEMFFGVGRLGHQFMIRYANQQIANLGLLSKNGDTTARIHFLEKLKIASQIQLQFLNQFKFQAYDVPSVAHKNFDLVLATPGSGSATMTCNANASASAMTSSMGAKASGSGSCSSSNNLPYEVWVIVDASSNRGSSSGGGVRPGPYWASVSQAGEANCNSSAGVITPLYNASANWGGCTSW